MNVKKVSIYHRFYAALTGIVTTLSLLVSAPAHAAQWPHPLISDQRVRQVAYDPNQVYEITGTYGYQTSIEFGQDEQVKVVTLGDSIAWQTVPYQNRLFIKPVEPNASTNLTVITSKRTYYFKLDSAKPSNQMTFLVRFIYPNGNSGIYAGDGSKPPAGAGDFNVADINMDYGVAGDRDAIGLHRVFDDGEFTYFLFNRNAEIPSFYTVGADGTESIVNTRREGRYMVVERTARMFTLRNGKLHLCVRNNAARRLHVHSHTA